MNSQKLLFSTLCCLALTACATTAPLSSYPQAQVLEQIPISKLIQPPQAM